VTSLSRDTTATAAAFQVELLRQMSPEERVELAARMSDDARAITEDGIRHRNPGSSSAQIAEALLEVMLGGELASRVRQLR